MALPSWRSLPSTRKSAPAPTSAWPRLIVLLSILIVFLFIWIAWCVLLTPVNLLDLKSFRTKEVFSLLVTLRFSALEHKEQFFKDMQPLADHCKMNEPDTISYEVLLSDKDPLQVLVLERYRDKENAFLQVHRSSAPFQEFRPKLKKMEDQGLVTIVGESYLDSGIGFGDRSG